MYIQLYISGENALRKVNEELILLYWNVGKYISEQMEKQKWGSLYIDELAKFISMNCPEIKGFNRRGLYRMKQFYETYKGNEFVSTLLTQISWSNHLAILSATNSSYFERYMLSTEKLEPMAVPKVIKDTFLDTYVLEFLNLPERFFEYDFKKAIISNLKKFILEIGKDFTFIGEEYR